MSESVQQHRSAAETSLSFGVLTISDTRSLADDSGGSLIVELLEGAGHLVPARRIVIDDRDAIVSALLDFVSFPAISAIISTGGTGLARRDVTFEAVNSILDRSIDGFGEIFRMLSYAEIGSAAMLSRATAGTIGSTVVFALPGSRNAIRLAMERIILPEIAHVVYEVRK